MFQNEKKSLFGNINNFWSWFLSKNKFQHLNQSLEINAMDELCEMNVPKMQP